MGQAPGRVIVLAAALVVGILVIAKGFSGQASVAGPEPTASSTSPAPSPSASSSANTNPNAPAPRPPSQVKLAVYNATSTGGLVASTVQTVLEPAGYKVVLQDNFPASPVTIIYYRNAQGKVDARQLRTKYFEGAQVKKLLPEAGVPKKAELAVILGSDYAATHPIT